MEISGTTAFYAGMSTIQTGQNRIDQASGQIANTTIERSVTSQSSEAQVDRRVGDLPSGLIDTVLPCLKGTQTGIKSGVS